MVLSIGSSIYVRSTIDGCALDKVRVFLRVEKSRIAIHALGASPSVPKPILDRCERAKPVQPYFLSSPGVLTIVDCIVMSSSH